jgi:hypothetical protein
MWASACNHSSNQFYTGLQSIRRNIIFILCLTLKKYIKKHMLQSKFVLLQNLIDKVSSDLIYIFKFFIFNESDIHAILLF